MWVMGPCQALLGRVDNYILERGMTENLTDLGAKPKMEYFPSRFCDAKLGDFHQIPSGRGGFSL